MGKRAQRIGSPELYACIDQRRGRSRPRGSEKLSGVTCIAGRMFEGMSVLERSRDSEV